jgi:hypothetical protein
VSSDRFAGPLFIIGTGRSGTKLLRDLLNRNPRIGIPTAETGFIPYMVGRFGNPPQFGEDVRQFDEFYGALSQTSFFWYMEREGHVLTKEHIRQVGDRTSWDVIFEFILRFYAPSGRIDAFIWGDKTPGPSHINHMTLLKTIFPSARFLHIIRDPRDVCLSMKRTWRKSLYRAATMWREEINTARLNSRQFSKDYREVFFESLLLEPEQVLRDVCKFLDSEYLPAMTTLEEPSEHVGDARGQARIVQDNTRKYRTRLSSSQVRRIEEIVYPIMRTTGYEPDHAVRFRPLSPLMLRVLTLYDGWATLRFDVEEKGLYEGLDLIRRAMRPYLVGISKPL